MSDSPNFDKLATVYRWMEYLSFGPLLWRARIRFLDRFIGCRRALVLGDGDGRFTAALLARNRSVRVHAVDLSPRMLAKLLERAGAHRNRVTTQVADLRCWNAGDQTLEDSAPDEKYDLIISHFFLDCLSSSEIRSLAQVIAGFSTPGALWAISDFAVPPTFFGALVARPLIAAMYFAFGKLTGLGQRTLPDHAVALSCAGWQLREDIRQCGGLLFSQLWQRPITGREPEGG